ncbi:hypothetical protein [Marinactinospora rubrisoli]|uniref:Uncharacterized protein n=1 Tax=Marinactinospora rubrisoli TaxID=2715399 RepID=A0ABW2KIM0_9ACTN
MKTILRRITLAGIVAPAIVLGTPALAGAQTIFPGDFFFPRINVVPESSFEQQSTAAGPGGASTFGTQSHARGGI